MPFAARGGEPNASVGTSPMARAPGQRDTPRNRGTERTAVDSARDVGAIHVQLHSQDSGGPNIKRRHLSVACACLLLDACSTPTDLERFLRVTTTVSANSIRLGAFVKIGVVAKNVGRRDVQVTPDHCAGNFTVEDPHGAVAGSRFPPNSACSLVGYTPQTLSAGDSLVFAYEWPMGAAYGDRGWAASVYPAGTYILRGYMSGPAGRVEGDGKAVHVVAGATQQ